MARSINTIKQQMLDAKAAESSLNDLTSNSKVAIWRLFIDIFSAAVNTFEQLLDSFKADVEDIADKAIAGTPQWVKATTLKFQYSATDPQVVELDDDLALVYPTVDEDLQVVTRCSVSTGANKNVNIKVAKDTSATDTTPIALAAGELSALQDYWDFAGFAGIKYVISSANSDKISITGEIFYKGQYSGTISADVQTAINNYFASIPFDGKVRVSAIEDAIQSVAGVVDYKLTKITGRADATAYASAVVVYDLSANINLVSYQLSAGYCVEEDTATKTFDDLLTFTTI